MNMKYLLLLFTLLTMTSCPFYMDKEAGVSINNQSDNDLYMEIGLYSDMSRSEKNAFIPT